MRVLSLVSRVALVGVASASLSRGMGAQTAAPRFGTQAKALVAEARTEAKRWRADAYLIQLTASRVTDGVAMWYYDFFAPGASGAQCLRVNFGKDKRAFTQQLKCDQAEPELKDFAVDSDKAIAIARAEGLKRPELTMGLMSVPTSSGQRFVWTIMEGNGMKEGDLTIDIDAQTGVVRGRRKL
jgi:hypothetical protein